AAGLDPWPKRTPLNPIVRGRRYCNGYAVDNVAFEPIPDYHATANLCWPSEPRVSHPLVLSCHGHGQAEIGRCSETQQIRCGILARCGAIVLALDMVGFGESLAHLPRSQSHATPMSFTLQTWTAIRALDLLTSLDRADASRIAVTGESGGGTQSFVLTALDERVSVSVPVVMVSAHFFGGCPCESGLPIHLGPDHFTTNAGIAALAAPRPQLLVSDGKDWTVNNPTVEFPFLQRIYGFYGKTEQVANVHLADEGHDYGPSKRQAMYAFVAKHLHLDLSAVMGADGRVDETWAAVAPMERLHVFDAAQPDNLRPDLASLARTLRSLQDP
ncbi:MAG TPA: acetylxylan esterase, partial [Planctomycetota bacterium]|nr:acetylxylan esterase [Planctomycetota bacterium]